MEEKQLLEELVERYPKLSSLKGQIWDAYIMLKECYENRNKLLIAGNGGSAADAEHIVGELMKGFNKKRPLSIEEKNNIISIHEELGIYMVDKIQQSLPAIALTNTISLDSAFANDVDGVLCIAQQLNGYGNKGDVFLAISTSGNSKNILYATILARAKGMKIISLLGRDGGKMKDFSDISIIVPEIETYKIQELHLPIYHTLCLMLEETFFVS